MQYQNKRILFVYRNYSPESPGYKATVHIIEYLKERYDLVTHCNLDEKVVEFINTAGPGKKISALVTHVPYKDSVKSLYPVSHFMYERIMLTEAYQESLLILRKTKILMDIPIIAYTGAGNFPLLANIFWEVGGVDQIIAKTADPKKDSKEIMNVLEILIQNYEKLPGPLPEPIIKIEGDYTTTEVKVNLNAGVGFTSAAAIVKECDDYHGDVSMKKVNSAEVTETYNAKGILDFLSSPILEGEKVAILVKGLDEKAERLVKRLYAAFSSRYPFHMDFGKFDKIQAEEKI